MAPSKVDFNNSTDSSTSKTDHCNSGKQHQQHHNGDSIRKIEINKQDQTKIPRASSRGGILRKIEQEIINPDKEQTNEDGTTTLVTSTCVENLKEQQQQQQKKFVTFGKSTTFRIRRSFSQMEIQRIRTSSHRHSSRAIVPANLALKAVTPRGDTTLERTFLVNDEFYCFSGGHRKGGGIGGGGGENEMDAKLAGMRIFATIMLNAWRRRRDEVRKLNEDVDHMKKNNIKLKNQIHVINSLFKIEQKQNDELNFKLRRLIDDQKKFQGMYDELNISFVELKAKNCLVEKELVIREKEYDGLGVSLREAKSQLLKTMTHEKELEVFLSIERKKVQELENTKNELLSQLTQNGFDSCDKQMRLEDEIAKKDDELSKLRKLLDSLDKKLCDLKNKESQLKEFEKIDISQRKAIEELKQEIISIKNELNNSLGSKMKTFWKHFPEKSFQYGHLLMFYLLPALPAPMIKTWPTPKLDGALGLIWKY